MRVEDLEVYQKLVELVMQVHALAISFPKYEMYELGSQIRRSSNSCAANLAEGFGNKHRNIYSECISRAQGEIRETKHHLRIAGRKQYIAETVMQRLYDEYESCSKMLFRLDEAVTKKWQNYRN